MPVAITVRTDRGEERLDLEEFELRVARGQIAPQCPANFPPVTGLAFVPAGSLEIFRQRYSPRELRFSRSFRMGGLPRVTLAFTALNVAWYAAMQLWPHGSADDTLLAYGAKAGPLLVDLGETWRLLTANLVHRDLLHIGMNLFVLFNFAGALENAFRPWDMALILLASALGTTVLSALVTDPISAGASGVAYGALGSAVVFGMKYRSLLPERHREVLGGAVVPTVLVFLFLGFTSSGVDNWGHLGGLLAGALTTAVLKPRLLSDPPTGQRLWATRVWPIAGAVVAACVAGPLLRGLTPRWSTRLDSELGLSLAVPGEWLSVPSRSGAFGEAQGYANGLVGYGEARLDLGGVLVEGRPDLAALLDGLVKKELWEPEADERLQVVSLEPVRPVALAHGALSGLGRAGVFRRGDLVFDFDALVIARGQLCYLLETFSARDEPGYRDLLARMVSGIELAEPDFLRRARAKALFLPAASAAQAEFDAALAAIGEVRRQF